MEKDFKIIQSTQKEVSILLVTDKAVDVMNEHNIVIKEIRTFSNDFTLQDIYKIVIIPMVNFLDFIININKNNMFLEV